MNNNKKDKTIIPASNSRSQFKALEVPSDTDSLDSKLSVSDSVATGGSSRRTRTVDVISYMKASVSRGDNEPGFGDALKDFDEANAMSEGRMQDKALKQIHREMHKIYEAALLDRMAKEKKRQDEKEQQRKLVIEHGYA